MNKLMFKIISVLLFAKGAWCAGEIAPGSCWSKFRSSAHTPHLLKFQAAEDSQPQYFDVRFFRDEVVIYEVEVPRTVKFSQMVLRSGVKSPQRYFQDPETGILLVEGETLAAFQYIQPPQTIKGVWRRLDLDTTADKKMIAVINPPELQQKPNESYSSATSQGGRIFKVENDPLVLVANFGTWEKPVKRHGLTETGENFYAGNFSLDGKYFAAIEKYGRVFIYNLDRYSSSSPQELALEFKSSKALWDDRVRLMHAQKISFSPSNHSLGVMFSDGRMIVYTQYNQNWKIKNSVTGILGRIGLTSGSFPYAENFYFEQTFQDVLVIKPKDQPMEKRYAL